MAADKNKGEHVFEKETVEVEVDKGVSSGELTTRLHGVIKPFLQKWMNEREAEVEAGNLIVKMDNAGFKAVS